MALMPSPDPHGRVSHEIEIRFYAELSDFLAPERRPRVRFASGLANAASPVF